MSEHASPPTFHTKTRGKIRRCDWCSEVIAIGDTYARWLWYDSGECMAVYAHKECRAAIELADPEPFETHIRMTGDMKRGLNEPKHGW